MMMKMEKATSVTMPNGTPDPFEQEVEELKALPANCVEVLHVAHNSRRVVLKIKSADELWVSLNIKMPCMYPMQVEPAIEVESCSKILRTSRADMLATLSEECKKTVAGCSVCLRRIVDCVLSKFHEYSPSVYPRRRPTLVTQLISKSAKRGGEEAAQDTREYA